MSGWFADFADAFPLVGVWRLAHVGVAARASPLANVPALVVDPPADSRIGFLVVFLAAFVRGHG